MSFDCIVTVLEDDWVFVDRLSLISTLHAVDENHWILSIHFFQTCYSFSFILTLPRLEIVQPFDDILERFVPTFLNEIHTIVAAHDRVV